MDGDKSKKERWREYMRAYRKRKKELCGEKNGPKKRARKLTVKSVNQRVRECRQRKKEHQALQNIYINPGPLQSPQQNDDNMDTMKVEPQSEDENLPEPSLSKVQATIEKPLPFTFVTVQSEVKHNMGKIKVEPESDDEKCPEPSLNEVQGTDEQKLAAFPLATVKSEVMHNVVRIKVEPESDDEKIPEPSLSEVQGTDKETLAFPFVTVKSEVMEEECDNFVKKEEEVSLEEHEECLLNIEKCSNGEEGVFAGDIRSRTQFDKDSNNLQEHSTCSKCGKEIKSLSQQTKEKQLCKSCNTTLKDGKRHQCEVCGKEFPRLVDVMRHFVVHPGWKNHQCGICDKMFPSNLYLMEHFRVHKGPEPTNIAASTTTTTTTTIFQCQECNKTFRRNKSLKAHARVHIRDKPFECNTCQMKFVHKSSLKLHYSVTHAGKNSFKCDVCGKEFVKKAQLNLHSRTHTGEKPYNCDICKKFFTQKSSLKSHYLLHTGETPFHCDICGAGFTRRFYLNTHSRTHSEPTANA